MVTRRFSTRRKPRERKVYGRRRTIRRRVTLKRTELLQLGVICCLVIVIILILIAITGKKYKMPLEYVQALKVPGNTFGMLGNISSEHGLNLPRLITLYLLDNYYYPEKSNVVTAEALKQKYVDNYDQFGKKYDMDRIQVYTDLFSGILDDMKLFPVPYGYDSEEASYAYAESFGALINSRFEKNHAGTDILDRDNIPGRIPVVSMTNGTVKDIGWSNTYGYSIGIQTDRNYYLYGHLNSFSDNLVEGSKVTAGRILGYMGNTGYSSNKHSKGSIVTKLHIGIRVESSISSKEFWINPYPFLRLKESSRYDLTVQ